MKPYQEYILSLKTTNKFGVLTRVITQIRREGCNIKSINAGETTDKTISSIHINIESYNYLFEDILHRLENLSCVLEVHVCGRETDVAKEYALITCYPFKQPMQKILDNYGGKLLADDLAEIVTTPYVLDQLIDELTELGDIEVARSGVITIQYPVGGNNG